MLYPDAWEDAFARLEVLAGKPYTREMVEAGSEALSVAIDLVVETVLRAIREADDLDDPRQLQAAALASFAHHLRTITHGMDVRRFELRSGEVDA
jgi:hypothetical protein